VTAPSQRGRKVDGPLAHRCDLPEHDVTTRQGIRLTRPGRTLIDLADVLTLRGLERAVDQADYLRLDCTGLKQLPGAPRLRPPAAGARGARSGQHDHPLRSREAFLSLCRRTALPQPEVNADVEGHLSDFLWRSERLIVETDSRKAHTTVAAFEADRLRDANLLTARWRVLRVTDRRLENQPNEVTAQVRRLLAPTPSRRPAAPAAPRPP
jgi:very-short-patch-repair endonuclease